MSAYILGHSHAELRRLTEQSEFLRPITERMLLSAGLEAGMRVLDVGCGSGDVSFLVSEIVGMRGEVVGIDSVPAAIAHAMQRAEILRASNVTFRHATETGLGSEPPFDFAVGRYVLPYQHDPAAFIRNVAARMRRNGTVAFHEFDALLRKPGLNPVPLFDRIWGEMIETLGRNAASPDAASRLAAHFSAAGLKPAKGFCERTVGMQGSEAFFRWVAGSYIAVQTERNIDDDAHEVEDLALELEAAVAVSNSQVVADDQWCMWAKV